MGVSASIHVSLWRSPRARAQTGGARHAVAVVVSAVVLVLLPQTAFAALTIAKSSWNVIGLDSNNVNSGPNTFPVAAVVCNTGPSDATNLTTTFVWDSSNALLNLTGPATVNRGTLPAGSCVHAYYFVVVTRSATAYATTRRYHITASADGGPIAATPIRELYVERFVSQNRNTSQTPSGPTTVVVGQTYTYNWVGATAPQGYEQVANFIAFNDAIFRVLSVQSSYSSGPSPTAAMYNDACGWDDNPASGGYRSCAGSGKAGGTISMNVTVEVIGTGSTTLAGAIYDYSGSSYHYNADFGTNTLQVTAISGSADLAITKTDGVSSVSAGGTTTYTIVARNAGPSAAGGAIVRDPAVSGLSKTGVSCTAAGGAACPVSVTVTGLENGLVIPTLPSGGSVTFTVTALVTATTGSVANTATVAAPAGTTDLNLANNAATDTDAVTPALDQADVAVTKTNGVSTLSPGATTIYTVIVSNNGPNAVTGATVADNPPASLTFGEWTCVGSGGAVCSASGSGNVSAVVTLPVGSSVTFRINATVTTNASGSITNTAAVTLPVGTTDANPSNNSASDTDTIADAANQADLAITKTDGVSSLSPGSTTTYTIVVSNNGPNALAGATVTDDAPDSLTLGAWTCSASGGAACPGSGSGNLSAVVTLPVGGSITFQIAATVKPDASGSITNTATVTLPAGTADPNPVNNVATDTNSILAQRIGVAKSAGAPQQLGLATFEIPYTIVLSNIGPIPATNVQVTDALDHTFATGSPTLALVAVPTASGINGATASQCQVNSSFSGTGNATSLFAGNTTLAPGQGCAITIRVRVTYPTAASIPSAAQLNTAIASSHVTPGGVQIARDVSDSGSDPAGPNPGAPGDTGGSDDPTPVVLKPTSGPAPEPGPGTEREPETPAVPSLSITKAASATVTEIGDAITYAVGIRTHGALALPATSVEDHLPLGFSYIAGSARLTVGSITVPLPEPLGAGSRSLVFAIPAQPGANEATLTYRVRVSAGAQQGNGTNRAVAIAADGTRSNEAHVRVLVSSDVFTQQACLIGKVFVDGSGNRLQDANEGGVPGVTLYLEDGTSIVTDAAGNFSYCGVRAGTHVLKVDRTTLPLGTTLVARSNRSALDAGSAFLDVKFGEVHRVDFVVASHSQSAPRQTPATPAAAAHPMLAVGVVEGTLSFTSFKRPLATSTRPGDVFDEELRRFSRSFNDGKTVAAGRAAMFLHGSVRRDYRLSLSFDSERPDRGALFRDIQPDAFYPIYGDASQKRFDAQTSRRMYAKVERGRSHVLFGDLVTMTRETPARDLGTYARTLTGVQHRFERRNVVLNLFATRDTLRQVIDEFGGRGISGPYNVSNPNGVSGTEKVEVITRDRNQPAIVLSTQLLTRFLDYEFEPFSGRLLFRRPVPSMDEHLNPVSVRITYEVDGGGSRHWVDGIDGRIKLSPRVEIGGSWAQDKSPVSPYELASTNATVTFGTHTTVVAEAARSVATVNTNPFNQLFIPNLTDAIGRTSGSAARVELNHAAHGLHARVYAGVSDAEFHNPAATLNGGRAEAGARASYRVAETLQLRGDLIRSSDRLTGGARRGGSFALESKLKMLAFEVGLRHVSETAAPAQGSSIGLIQPFGTTALPGFGFRPVGNEIDPITGLPIVRPGAAPQLSAGRFPPLGQPLDATTLRAKLTTSVGKPWSAYVEGEHDVTGEDKYMAAVGGEYRAAKQARLYLRHELISSLDGIYALSEGQRTQRTVFGVSSTYQTAGELFSEYRMNEGISGREAQAAIGLRHAWTLREGLRLSTGFERLNPILSAGQAATAATFGAEYTRKAQFKGTSRLEWRREGSADIWLSTVGIARRLSRDWTMLAKNYYQLSPVPGRENQLQDRFWAGAAYRDSERNRHNLLSRYEFKFERLPQDGPSGTTNERHVHVVSTNGDYRRSQPWGLSAQYAGKWVREQLPSGREQYSAHLISGRAGYDLTSRFDVGGLASLLWSGSDNRLRKALGVEVGLLVKENTWLSLGYNLTGFSDRDFNDVLATDSTTRGFFIRLRLKFDEDLFRAAPGSRR